VTWLALTTAQKLVFLIALIAGSIGAGYVARRVGLAERIARILMWFVMTVPYTIVSFLAVWVLKFSAELLVLPLLGMIVLTAGVGVGAVLARMMRMNRPQAGAFVLSAGASNLGFTMGSFVNFALFGVQGLAVAQLYTSFWEFGMVFVLYPTARHYGHNTGAPLWRLILANFRDPRALPLLAAITGLTLNLAGVPRPAFIADLHLVDYLIVFGTVVAFFTTGLRLHFEQLGLHRRLYAIVAAVKFLFLPLVGACLVGIMWLLGVPLVKPDDAPAWKVVLVQASTPTAIYAVVISNLFNLDDKLASIVFVVNTATYLAVVLPILVFVFH